MQFFKYALLAISILSASLTSAREVCGFRILDNLPISQIIRSCKNVVEDKSKTNIEVSIAASVAGSLLQIDEKGTPEEIIGYFLLSAQKGRLSSFAEIGDLYRNGYKSLTPNYNTALRYYIQDTSKGPTYLRGVGELYLHGHGVEKSVNQAISSFIVAAHLENEDSGVRTKLCEIFSSDNYKKKDLVKAHFWCASAVDAESMPIMKAFYEKSRLTIEMQLSGPQLIEANLLKNKCNKVGVIFCTGTY